MKSALPKHDHNPWCSDCIAEGIRRATVAAPVPTGYHGEGEFDLHYDPRCSRCTANRDRLRPDPNFDQTYASTEDPTPNPWVDPKTCRVCGGWECTEHPTDVPGLRAAAERFHRIVSTLPALTVSFMSDEQWAEFWPAHRDLGAALATSPDAPRHGVCWFCKRAMTTDALIAGYDTFDEQRLACLACNERMSGNWSPDAPRVAGLDYGLAAIVRQYLRLGDAMPDEKPDDMPADIWDARIREVDNARRGVDAFLAQYAASHHVPTEPNPYAGRNWHKQEGGHSTCIECGKPWPCPDA